MSLIADRSATEEEASATQDALRAMVARHAGEAASAKATATVVVQRLEDSQAKMAFFRSEIDSLQESCRYGLSAVSRCLFSLFALRLTL